jgi:hypothetical protein
MLLICLHISDRLMATGPLSVADEGFDPCPFALVHVEAVLVQITLKLAGTEPGIIYKGGELNIILHSGVHMGKFGDFSI